MIWLKIIFGVAVFILFNSWGISLVFNAVDASYIRAAYRLNSVVWFGVWCVLGDNNKTKRSEKR